ncbi:hypothetical protein VNI00_011295 [Paramarasmius palmivorus]|uniref:Uncharacterized protein n=1 Tax=Paramarasmius palmivorus TaxID=297713 RepID=A0AAW0CHY1_9AGAR
MDDTVVYLIVFPVSTLSVMFFVYGFYVYLFGQCMYTLTPRRTENQKLYLALIVILFMNSTFMVIMTTIHTVWDMINFIPVIGGQENLEPTFSEGQRFVLYAFENLLPIIGSAAADTMLIHRCYVMWGYRKWVAVPLIIATTMTIGVNLAGAVLQLMGQSSTYGGADMKVGMAGEMMFAVVNIILTLLSGQPLRSRKNMVVDTGDSGVEGPSPSLVKSHHAHRQNNVSLESGLLLPITIFIHMGVAFSSPSIAGTPIDLLPLVVLVEGIAPTLVIVRAKKRTSKPAVASLPDIASAMRFTVPKSYSDAPRGHGQTDVDPQKPQCPDSQYDLEVLQAASKNGEA